MLFTNVKGRAGSVTVYTIQYSFTLCNAHKASPTIRKQGCQPSFHAQQERGKQRRKNGRKPFLIGLRQCKGACGWMTSGISDRFILK